MIKCPPSTVVVQESGHFNQTPKATTKQTFAKSGLSYVGQNLTDSNMTSQYEVKVNVTLNPCYFFRTQTLSWVQENLKTTNSEMASST
jgi:hypothetical protein